MTKQLIKLDEVSQYGDLITSLGIQNEKAIVFFPLDMGAELQEFDNGVAMFEKTNDFTTGSAGSLHYGIVAGKELKFIAALYDERAAISIDVQDLLKISRLDKEEKYKALIDKECKLVALSSVMYSFK